MKHLALILILMICAERSFAENFSDRTPGIFAGGGLEAGSLQLTPSTSTSTSNFTTMGYQGEIGLSDSFSDRWGFQFSLEGGADNAVNSISSTTYMEISSITSYGAKLGFYGGPFTFGGGYVYNDVNVKSISLNGNGYQTTEFNGWNPFAFANLTFDLKHRFRTVIEAQYLNGSLQGTSQGSVQINQITVGLRAFLLF